MQYSLTQLRKNLRIHRNLSHRCIAALAVTPDAAANYLPVATETDMEVNMSGKIIPAVVAAVLLAGTAAASAQAPSAESAGSGVGAFSTYSGYQGYYDYAPAPSVNGFAPGRYYDYAPAARYNGSASGRNYNDYNPGSSATR